MFKRLFAGILLVSTLAVAVSADTLPAFSSTTIFSLVKFEKAVIRSLDTIGGTDSFTVYRKGFKPDVGYRYALRIPAMTGGGTDSVAWVPVTRCFSPDSQLIESYIGDTLKVATGKTFLLPINRFVVGDFFEVMLKGIVGNGGQQIVPGIWVYKVK